MWDSSDALEFLITTFTKCESVTRQIHSEEICALVHSTLPEIREWTAKALVNDTSSDVALSALCELAADGNPDVRVEAVDTLSAFVCHDSFSALCNAIDDEDELVRAYASYGIGFVGNVIAHQEAVNILKNAEKFEKCKRVLVGIFEGLYILGYDECLDKLFDLFGTNDSQIQSAVLHALRELMAEDNCEVIMRFIANLKKHQYPRSVSDLISKIQRGDLR